MPVFNTRKVKPQIQYLISIALVIVVAVTCFFSGVIGHQVVALIQLLAVSALAMLFDILPVLCAAILSALIWNFLFIPPVFTFHITNTADLLLFLMYFTIALVNAVLTFKIRHAEKKARDKEEREHTIKLYNTLINSLTHELRTPIATIIGAVDTLKEYQHKLSPDHQAELLVQINTAGIRLNQQVENILNMSRLESGILKLKLDWCDVNELIFSVIREVSLQHKNQQIIFVPNERLPLFKMDTGLMEQVLYNIIHNAAQYTPEHSFITIDASFESDQCRIIVSDNGNGFPENEIPFLFDKFYRLPNSKAGGSGLGLSISKGFVEAHEGKISAENITEGGAKFIISIPAETSFISSLKNE